MPVRSRLARLLQTLIFLQLAAALAWLVLRLPYGALQAALGAAVILLLAPIVLGVEFILLGLLGRSVRSTAPSALTLFGAWLGEIGGFFRVFCVRMPFAWDAMADELPASARGKPGVLFIHGFACNRGIWTPWMRQLQARGHAFVAVNLEPVFTPIDRYAPQVEDAVLRLTQACGEPPLVVCHSMGGLAARAWLRSHAANAQRVRHVVTIASPHQGTWLARFSHLPNGRQMRRASDWLQQLQAHERQTSLPAFTCWYTNCDNIVFPVACATLPGADNRLIRGVAHVDLAFHPEVVAGTLLLLEKRQLYP